MKHTFSFAWFDDLDMTYSRAWDFEDGQDLKPFLRKIEKDFRNAGAEQSYFFEHAYSEDEIIDDLKKDKYYVINRFEKYYVFAMAIDYKKFWIWSKDCDAEIIEWGDGSGDRSGDENEPVADNYDPDYDVSPVVNLLEKLQS